MALPGLSTFRRSISARLVERFIFNFRLSPNSFEEKLPIPWLRPQVINGWSAVSFCILKVEQLMLQPIPSSFGLETICCAYRCGVIDCSRIEEPSVYILGRNTDRHFISMMAPSIFQSEMPPIQATIGHRRGYREIAARCSDGRPLFSARVPPRDKATPSVEGVWISPRLC